MAAADESADVFGTHALRDAVLAAWRSSPTRFREDANSEEDLVRGGYRDRLVVELAQNAADAAARDGRPGRVLFRLRGGLLEVSNTGSALDAAGVESLAALRASAKRDGDTAQVGRFGVGFAAALAVCDSPVLRSTQGGVRFSAAETLAAVRAEPSLADEVARREDQVPVLRLPFAESTPPEPGYDTTVVLPLRDADAVAVVHRLLDDVDAGLLLALPSLGEVVVETELTTAAHWRPRSLTTATSWCRTRAGPCAGGSGVRWARSRPSCWPTGPLRSGRIAAGQSPGPSRSTQKAARPDCRRRFRPCSTPPRPPTNRWRCRHCCW